MSLVHIALKDRDDIIVPAGISESRCHLEALKESRVGPQLLESACKRLLGFVFTKQALDTSELRKGLNAPVVLAHEPPGVIQGLLGPSLLNNVSATSISAASL